MKNENWKQKLQTSFDDKEAWKKIMLESKDLLLSPVGLATNVRKNKYNVPVDTIMYNMAHRCAILVTNAYMCVTKVFDKEDKQLEQLVKENKANFDSIIKKLAEQLKTIADYQEGYIDNPRLF